MPTSWQLRLEQLPPPSDLPSSPVVGLMVLECASQPNWTTSELVSIIRNDPMMTARLTDAASREHSGRMFGSLDEAVAAIGSDATASIALSAFLERSDSFHEGFRGQCREKYWQYSVVQAVAAETLARAGDDDPGEMRLMGLMANAGVFALISKHPVMYLPLLEKHAGSTNDLLRAEKVAMGFTHVEFGQKLIRSWGMSDIVADALQGTLDSAVDLLTEPDIHEKRLRCACYLSSRIAELYAGTQTSNQVVIIESLAMKYFGIRIEDLLSKVDQELRSVGPMVGIAACDLSAPALLHKRAKAELRDSLKIKSTRGPVWKCPVNDAVEVIHR